MKRRPFASKALLIIVFSLASSPTSFADSVTAGTQDFVNGAIIDAGNFAAASIGEPAPFDRFYGSDITKGSAFFGDWQFNFLPAEIQHATITIGIFDHDSMASGNQVAGFLLDSFDLTALLNTEFELYGGEQSEYNVYTVLIPAATVSTLADGTASFSLTLQPPGLGNGIPRELNGNGAGLDFARLDFFLVPEPQGLLLFTLSAGLMASRRCKRRH